MSLLMDALRKAELEKKKAAERLEQTVEHAQVSEGEVVEDQEPEAEAESTSEHQITRMDRTHVRSKEEIFAATAQLSLEPIERIIKHERPDSEDLDNAARELSEDLNVDITADHQVKDQGADMEDTMVFPQIELTGDQTEELDQELDTGTDSPLDESFHDELISTDREIPGIYDETIQGEAYHPQETERVYDETLPGVSAAELARDLGEENQPTPVAAQTVFTAGATRQVSLRNKWPIIVGLVLIVVLAVSIIIYQSVTPLVSEIPTRQLAGDLDLVKPPPEPPTVAQTTPPATPGSGSTTPAQANQQPQEVATAKPTETGQQPPEPATATPAAAGQQSPQPAVTKPTEAVAQTAPATNGEPAATGDTGETQPEVVGEVRPVVMKEEPPAAPPVDTPVSQPLKEPEPDLIKISHSQSVDQHSKILHDAYAAYQSGDLDEARNKYEQAIKYYPDNRDALLGLGAVAMKEGDLTRGYEIYSRLYKLDPRDPVARAVLVNMDYQTDPVSRESTLKLMIDNNPKQAFLYFALGNVYAAQSRWSEAEQAYFDAYRNNSANPDFALNLAISLDHIGQYKSALDYYKTALKLADDQAPVFDSKAVRARIQTLAAADTEKK